jgi:hypothetical protein
MFKHTDILSHTHCDTHTLKCANTYPTSFIQSLSIESDWVTNMALSARVVQHFIGIALKQQVMSNKIPASSAQSVSYGNLRLIKPVFTCILQAYISEAKAEEARKKSCSRRHEETLGE